MRLNLEFFLVFSSLMLIFGYHVWYYFQIKREPLITSRGFNDHAHTIWVKHIRENELDILAVQTLRNWTMSATFLASTAILLSLGILSFALTTEGLSEIAHAFNFLGSTSHTALLIKALFLGANFMFAFIAFVLSVRFYNHAAFLINIPENYHLSINSNNVCNAIKYGAIFYNLGMRSYYLSMPLIFWLLGPIWMFICALLVIFIVYKLDHGI